MADVAQGANQFQKGQWGEALPEFYGKRKQPATRFLFPLSNTKSPRWPAGYNRGRCNPLVLDRRAAAAGQKKTRYHPAGPIAIFQGLEIGQNGKEKGKRE